MTKGAVMAGNAKVDTNFLEGITDGFDFMPASGGLLKILTCR